MKKRLFLVMISSMLMIILLGVSACAEIVGGSCGDNATYTFDTLTGEIVISGTGQIKADAFHDISNNDIYGSKLNIKNVIINEGITGIGGWAFSGCKNLKNVSLPSTLKEIQAYAFANCENITKMTIPKGVTLIDWGTFSECTGLEEITLNDGLDIIKDYAFDGCKNLKGIDFPEGITQIGQCAFRDCSKIKRVEFPSSLIYVGYEPFEKCSGVTKVIVKSKELDVNKALLPDSPFKTLGPIGTDADVEVVLNGEKFPVYLEGLNSLRQVIIPEGVTEVMPYQFNDCKNLFSMYVPNSVKEIYNDTFKGCNKLTVKGYSGSYIESACQEYGVRFRALKEGEDPYKFEDDFTPVQSFVDRLYTKLLDRKADKDGLNDWADKLSDGTACAAQIVEGIVNSAEFENRQLSNEEIVEVMYGTMLGRDSDEGGKAFWTGELDAGLSVNYIINGFSGSEEFGKICNEYGISAGSITLGEARDQNKGISSFVARCYEKALGRKFEKGGINYWCEEVLNAPDKKVRAEQVASDGFFHSEEFMNKNTSNDEYVDILYRTFLGREADEAGKADWVGRLNSGVDRDEVLHGFSRSVEFANIMSQYGL